MKRPLKGVATKRTIHFLHVLYSLDLLCIDIIIQFQFSTIARYQFDF